MQIKIEVSKEVIVDFAEHKIKYSNIEGVLALANFPIYIHNNIFKIFINRYILLIYFILQITKFTQPIYIGYCRLFRYYIYNILDKILIVNSNSEK